ncbi:transcription elongation factor GreAB [Dyadobacter luteus]|uniref:Transcription elongation factor GreAB n=1 Tax=Dyadobacter luteus TaxID=2259619 RepID=A0A3D8YB22_9BACT|nr:GreA/GreB family elongation factor [Dyadobacter luteus]REA60959.1 transcription elongation factor GreAB [Dyadobacter luteus]
MSLSKTPVIISEGDYKLLKQFAEQFPAHGQDKEMTLSYELNRAVIVENDELPEGCVRLNSTVKVRELTANQDMEFSIVMPSLADMNQRKISVLTPMGAALIGLCKGEKVKWQMPSGLRHFEILEVI